MSVVMMQSDSRWSRRPVGAVRQAAVLLLVGWGALALTIAVLSGASAQQEWDVLVATALLGLFAAVLRPVFVAMAGCSAGPGSSRGGSCPRPC